MQVQSTTTYEGFLARLAQHGLEHVTDCKEAPEHDTPSTWVVDYVSNTGQVVAREFVDRYNGQTYYRLVD
jgi:hypothetical protein